jgi:hypothetical protein
MSILFSPYDLVVCTRCGAKVPASESALDLDGARRCNPCFRQWVDSWQAAHPEEAGSTTTCDVGGEF